MEFSKFSHLKSNIIDKNYISSNIFIKIVLKRLQKKIAGLMSKINSTSLLTLDIGCGEGHMIEYLHTQQVVGRYIGADLNLDKVLYAATCYPFCKYLAADVNELGFKSNTFECIIAAEMLEHVHNPIKALEEIKRVAKPSAHLIISVPNEPLFRWCNLLRGKYWNRGGRTPTHVNFWNRSEFKKLMRQYCEIEKEHFFSTFPWLLFQCKF